MGFVRRHLTYANVAATLALFLALGGAAYAATQLPRNSVGTRQLRNGSVTKAKIAKRTRRQLRGLAGPQGPQGKIGKTGKTGAKGATGATGAAGAAGTGPAFEVFTATAKPITGQVLAQTLAPGAYVIGVDATISYGGTGTASIGCSINGGGEMKTNVGAGESTTLSASITRSFGTATAVTFSCTSNEAATEVTYANMIATQVKSQARAGA